MSIAPNPYAAPVAHAPATAPASWRSAIRRAATCLGVSLGTGALIIAALGRASSRIVGGVGFSLVALCSALGLWCACATLFRAAQARPTRMALIALGGVGLLLVHGAMTLFGTLCALLSAGGGRGRQLRRFGRVLLPTLRSGSGRAWAPSPS